MAKPIVVTDVAPLNELLQVPAGLAVPVGDGVTLAGAIEKMLVEGRSYGERGRRLVEDQYGLDSAIEKYERVYQEALDGVSG